MSKGPTPPQKPEKQASLPLDQEIDFEIPITIDEELPLGKQTAEPPLLQPVELNDGQVVSYVSAVIDHELGGFAANSQYRLNATPGGVVTAFSDPVNSGRRLVLHGHQDVVSTPVSYMFNKHTRPLGETEQAIQELLDFEGDDPTKLTIAQNHPLDSIRELVSEDDTFATLRPKLEGLQRASQHDVFDEIIPAMNGAPSAARIIFPYNTMDGGHWVTGEINITRTFVHNAYQYEINMAAHDPLGNGRIDPRDAQELANAVSARIAEEHNTQFPLAQVNVNNFHATSALSPYRAVKRQNDGVSCGAIGGEEMVKRLQGQDPNTIYPENAITLREQQIQKMKHYYGEESPVYQSYMQEYHHAAEAQGKETGLSDAFGGLKGPELDKAIKLQQAHDIIRILTLRLQALQKTEVSLSTTQEQSAPITTSTDISGSKMQELPTTFSFSTDMSASKTQGQQASLSVPMETTGSSLKEPVQQTASSIFMENTGKEAAELPTPFPIDSSGLELKGLPSQKKDEGTGKSSKGTGKDKPLWQRKSGDIFDKKAIDANIETVQVKAAKQPKPTKQNKKPKVVYDDHYRHVGDPTMQTFPTREACIKNAVKNVDIWKAQLTPIRDITARSLQEASQYRPGTQGQPKDYKGAAKGPTDEDNNNVDKRKKVTIRPAQKASNLYHHRVVNKEEASWGVSKETSTQREDTGYGASTMHFSVVQESPNTVPKAIVSESGKDSGSTPFRRRGAELSGVQPINLKEAYIGPWIMPKKKVEGREPRETYPTERISVISNVTFRGKETRHAEPNTIAYLFSVADAQEREYQLEKGTIKNLYDPISPDPVKERVRNMMLDMATDKPHCSECSMAMRAVFGEKFNSATPQDNRLFENWGEPFPGFYEIYGITNPYRQMNGQFKEGYKPGVLPGKIGVDPYDINTFNYPSSPSYNPQSPTTDFYDTWEPTEQSSTLKKFKGETDITITHETSHSQELPLGLAPIQPPQWNVAVTYEKTPQQLLQEQAESEFLISTKTSSKKMELDSGIQQGSTGPKQETGSSEPFFTFGSASQEFGSGSKPMETGSGFGQGSKEPQEKTPNLKRKTTGDDEQLKQVLDASSVKAPKGKNTAPQKATTVKFQGIPIPKEIIQGLEKGGIEADISEKEKKAEAKEMEHSRREDQRRQGRGNEDKHKKR